MRCWRVLSGVLALSLVMSVGAGTSQVTAQSDDEDPVYFDAIYFPWVPNGDEINGTGPWHGSITIQNIDVEANNLGVRFWVFDSQTINQIALNDDGNGGAYSFGDALNDSTVPRFDLDPNASVTLSAGILGLPEPGSAVAVYALYKGALGPEAFFDARPPTIAGLQKQAMAQPMTNARTTSSHLSVDGYSAIPLSDVAWGSQSDFCYALSEGIDSCDGTGFYSLDGLAGFDGHSYLPIVQTNSGWNTEIYLSNVDFTGVTAAQVDVTLIETDQQGAAASGAHKATETVNVPPGGTALLDVRSMVGDEWVGSAHVTSTVGISAVAMRSKPSDDMLMINTSAPSLWATTGTEVPVEDLAFQVAQSGYEQYAPLVFRDYNGWNTGISFVNISEQTNRVSVSFYGPTGNVVASDTRTISPQGQEFIYIPATQDLGAGGGTGEGFVGAAVFRAEYPFHVAIDQVKYETGEAMSYLATATGASPDMDGALSMPLVQKGWLDGTGDTSGLQLFNASVTDSVTFELHFYNSSGAVVGPTGYGPIRTTLGPHELSTIYTLNLSEMSQNQRASAVVTPVEGSGVLVGVSNNVNYSVEGDGSSAFNMVNLQGQYRLPAPGFTGER